MLYQYELSFGMVLSSLGSSTGNAGVQLVSILQKLWEAFCLASVLGAMAVSIRSAQVYNLKEELTNAGVEYPPYYINHFHAYDEGNLGWEPAFEAESATKVRT